MSRALTVSTHPAEAGADDPVPSIRGLVIAGVAAITIGFGGFVLWGATVRLDSAATAAGSVVVDSRRKTITHLEGGILKQMLVREGEEVHAGQPLALLESTRARAELGQLEARRTGYMARLARLSAEQQGLAEVSFPPELTASTQTYVQEILRNERLLFSRRFETFERTSEAQRKQIAAFTAQADANAAQAEATARQEQLVRTQIDAITKLANQGFATRAQLLDLEGRLSMLAGDAGEYKANKAQAEQARAGAEAELSKIETSRQSDIADAMQQARIELNASTDQMAAAADVLKRVEILSPDDGVVTDIQMRTPGGVIGAGQPIMEIVPENDARIVEARIDPRDIDTVHVGATVQVRLPAYNAHKLAPLEGTLTYVAADQSVDERTSQAYYVVRAEVSKAALEKVPNVKLYPGMPADLLILNQPRLAIDYMLSPLTDSLGRAFREE